MYPDTEKPAKKRITNKKNMKEGIWYNQDKSIIEFGWTLR